MPGVHGEIKHQGRLQSLKDNIMRITLVAAICLVLPAIANAQDAPKPQRAVLAGVVNSTKDRHTIMLRTTADALRMEFIKNNTYDVVPWPEIEHAAKLLKMENPSTEDDFIAIAKKVDAPFVIIGEIKSIDIRTRDKAKEVEVSLVVRVRDAASDDLINGAAERGDARDAPNGKKTEALMIVDAAESAAVRCAARIASYKPLDGTILNSPGNGPIVLNRGMGHGVKAKQEFSVYRGGIKVGKLQVGKVFPQYSELGVVQNLAGIQPGDHVVSVFAEPRFTSK
jgi:hypothetical protein